MCKDLNQYKISVYRDPPQPMCNLTNKALARYLFKMLASCFKMLIGMDKMAPTGNQSTGAMPLVLFIPGDPTLVG